MLQRWALLLSLMALAGCGGNATPLIVTMPPTSTLVASATPIASPSPTLFIPPTVTLAPTRTPAPAGSVVANPLRPTFTLAPATQTATFAPELAGLSIEYFITNTEEPFAPGDTITLFWRVSPSTANTRIFRLNSEGKRAQVWNVNSEGRLRVVLAPEEGQPSETFLVQAELGGSVTEQRLVLDVGCPFSWFFLPPPDSCPAAAAVASLQVEQAFEGGLMIWVAETQQIYILYNDGTWQQVADTFSEGQPERDESLVAPPERYQPVRGFGLVWRTQRGVSERLGWALEPEVGYDGMLQSGGQTLYLRSRAGGILRLEPKRWEILPAETPE